MTVSPIASACAHGGSGARVRFVFVVVLCVCVVVPWLVFPTVRAAPIVYNMGFNFPEGVFVDANNNIWVAESNSNNVRVVSSSGVLLHTYGGMSGVVSVAVLPNGDFLAALWGNGVSLVQMRPTGTNTATQVFAYNTVNGVQASGFWAWVDYDSNGNIYVSQGDTGNGIIRFTPGVNNGVVFIPNAGTGGAVFVDSTHLYTTLGSNVRRYSLSCAAPCTTPDLNVAPPGITANLWNVVVDAADGSLYLCDFGSPGYVRQYNAAGTTLINTFTLGGNYNTAAADIDSFGNLVTNDINNGRIVIFPNAAAVVQGDPQFIGFHGQSFQIHGYPEEWFNIISTPTLQINAKFKYIDSGVCNYNNTACWTHPGTYMSAFGIVFGRASHGVDHISLVSGSHAKGMVAFVNDNPLPLGSHVHLSRSSKDVKYLNDSDPHAPTSSSWSHDLSMSLSFSSFDTFQLSTSMLSLKFINSDGFFNLESTLNHELVKAGAKHVDYRKGKNKNYKYPNIPIHGLIGQTWRNAVYDMGRLYEGEVDDYVMGKQFGTTCTFCNFQPQ